VRILDLAENLIRLSGFEPGVDIPIVFTGPRPGEKLFEELLTVDERSLATRHRRIFRGRIDAVDADWLDAELSRLLAALENGVAPTTLVTRLHEIVPTFRPFRWAEPAASLDRDASKLEMKRSVVGYEVSTSGDREA